MKQVGYYASLPRARISFTTKKGVIKFFTKHWLPVWSLAGTVAELYYVDDRFKVWRFMGAM